MQAPMRSLIRYKPVETSGDFFQPSPYRGAGPGVDAAWDKLWMSQPPVSASAGCQQLESLEANRQSCV